MSAPEAALPRAVKFGRYELISRIGAGGMAEVQLALQRGPGGFEKLVVVKLIHEHLATQKPIVDMLLDEARVAALVKHPNVVDIYDLGEVDGTYFIAMEYLEGEPVLSLLRAGRDGKRLDPLSTARMVADAAEGLDAAHELKSLGGEPIELVHHDVSLGNIVVLYNGQVKLVDFGVAKAQRAAGGEPGKTQGKFGYMAPEKLRGGSGDRRSDIFSLGVVLWEALTLKRLFRGGNDNDTLKQVLETPIALPSQVNPDVPRELDVITMRALERDPALRYQTASDMANALEDVLQDERYHRKNDLIAKYMQDTFKEHIDARRQLLQDVSSKGAASAEVIEAAFAEPELATGSAPHAAQSSSEFSVKFRRVSSELPVHAGIEIPEGAAEIISMPYQRPLSQTNPPAHLGPSDDEVGGLDHAGASSLADLVTRDATPTPAVIVLPPAMATVAAPSRTWLWILIALVVLGGGAFAVMQFVL